MTTYLFVVTRSQAGVFEVTADSAEEAQAAADQLSDTWEPPDGWAHHAMGVEPLGPLGGVAAMKSAAAAAEGKG